MTPHVHGRIIYLTGNWSQPSETFIRREAELLRANGVPLAVASVFGAVDASSDVFVLNHEPQQPGTAAPSTARPRLKSLRTRLALMRHRRKVDDLIAWAKSEGATHLHAAFGGLPALLCAEAAKRMGLPHSASVHANDVLCASYSDTTLYKTADRVFCCNHHAMNQLLRRSPWLKPTVELAPHGVDPSSWSLRVQPLTNSPLRFLFVGRLVEKKDPQRAVVLIDALNERGIPAELTMIGDGDFKPKQGNVLGFQPHKVVREHMETSDFLICTSRETANGDAEGVPNVILEAMAVGLPVISTVSGSIGEVVSEDTGYVIDSDESFITHVERAMVAPDDRLRKVQAARDLIGRDWDVNRLIEPRASYFCVDP